MKLLAGIVVVAVTFTVLSVGTAFAQRGAPGFDIKENRERVKAKGPGFKVKLTKRDLQVRIDDARFGIPEAGLPDPEVAEQSRCRRVEPAADPV